MAKKIKERFGILIRPTGRFETVQVGFVQDDAIKDKRGMEDALSEYFGGDFEWAKNAEELAYVTRDGAFDEGRPRNDAASYFAGIGRYGDCIVLPQKEYGERVAWSQLDAYRMKTRMECDWTWYCDYLAHPENYNIKPKKSVKA